jgi:butyrate response factor
MEGELEALSPARPSSVSSKGDGRSFDSLTRAAPLETLMDSPLSCVSHGRGGGSGSVFSPPTAAPSLETQLKSPSSCISDNHGSGGDFGFSSPTRASLLKMRPNSPSSSVFDSRGCGNSSSLRVSKESEHKVQEAERKLRVITERYNDCFLRLRDATAELVDLRRECVRLRAENLQLSLLLAELEAEQSNQASAVALIPPPMPVQAEAACGCAPKCISIRSKGFLSQQQQPRDESTPQRLRVRASLAAEVSPQILFQSHNFNSHVTLPVYLIGNLDLEILIPAIDHHWDAIWLPIAISW